MIAKGTTHRHGAALARYLVTPKDRERAELWELQGFACSAIVPAFRSVHVMAAATKCLAPFFHVAIRPPDHERLDRSQWNIVVKTVARILGLADQPRAVAFHTDEFTGHGHMHLAFSRIDHETLTAKPLPFFKQRLKLACRELEQQLGLTAVPNKRQSSIAFAPTRAEEEQARRLGVDVHATREAIKHCFERSDCGRSFREALVHEGLALARGDRRDFLVADREGGVHAVGKRIVGVSAASIRDRLADLSPEALPTLEEVRSSSNRTQPAKPSQTAAHERVVSADGGLRAEERHQRCRGNSRAAGRKLRSEAVLMEPGIAEAPEPLGSISLPESVAPEFVETATNENSDQPSLPAVAFECETELADLADAVAAPKGATGDCAAPSESEQPAEEKAPVSVKRPTGLLSQIRSQFRAVAKQLIGRVSAPTLRKRRREEVGGAFRVAARWCVRHAARIPPFHFLDPAWEPFTWLRLWDYNDSTQMELHHDTSMSSASRSLHL
jgi:hypothetical protein